MEGTDGFGICSLFCFMADMVDGAGRWPGKE